MPNPIPKLGEDGRIVEGIITTLNEDGSVNIAPLGPIIEKNFECFLLRPFQSSKTYKNIKRLKQAVFHVTDDVNLIAESALGTPDSEPHLIPAQSIEGQIITDACRWYALEIHRIDDSSQRTQIEAKCVDQGRFRDFLGYNRAQHAVIEAAILATRLEILPPEEILCELERLKSPVMKTASQEELKAFKFLQTYIESSLKSSREISS